LLSLRRQDVVEAGVANHLFLLVALLRWFNAGGDSPAADGLGRTHN
jgi:hypothetical protein